MQNFVVNDCATLDHLVAFISPCAHANDKFRPFSSRAPPNTVTPSAPRGIGNNFCRVCMLVRTSKTDCQCLYFVNCTDSLSISSWLASSVPTGFLIPQTMRLFVNCSWKAIFEKEDHFYKIWIIQLMTVTVNEETVFTVFTDQNLRSSLKSWQSFQSLRDLSRRTASSNANSQFLTANSELTSGQRKSYFPTNCTELIVK